MQTFPALLRQIYEKPAYIAVLPSLAALIDYSLTFFLAGNNSMILHWEASPLVRFAVANNIVILYLLTISIFYFITSYLVLRILKSTRYYSFGAGLIGFVSVIHVLGGLSWQFKNAWYSNGIVTLSFVSIIIALSFFGYVYLRQERSSQ